MRRETKVLRRGSKIGQYILPIAFSSFLHFFSPSYFFFFLVRYASACRWLFFLSQNLNGSFYFAFLIFSCRFRFSMPLESTLHNPHNPQSTHSTLYTLPLHFRYEKEKRICFSFSLFFSFLVFGFDFVVELKFVGIDFCIFTCVSAFVRVSLATFSLSFFLSLLFLPYV